MAQRESSFNVRALNYRRKAINENFAMVQISASNDAIPLRENWAERWCTLGKGFENIMDEVLNFEIRLDDVFVNSFMKCGTTWMQEAAWLLLNNLDFERAKQTNISERSVNLDGSGAIKREPTTMEQCRRLSSPRLIKTHLPPNLLPRQVWIKKTKIIFVARNLKDCIVSAYHFIQNLSKKQFTMAEFIEDFLNNGMTHAPYMEMLLDYWKMRHEPNIYFVTYEEMKRDLCAVLQRLCKFLGRPQLTPEELQKTIQHLSFDNMKTNKNSNINDYCKDLPTARPAFNFMRRGIIGSYKDELSLENQRILDDFSSGFLAQHGLKEQHIFGNI